jgi:hypothetical protein
MPTYTSLTASSALTFDDEFNSFLASPDGSVGWMTTYPWGGESARALPSNGQAEYLSDATVGVDPFSDSNGVLTISATQASAGSNPYGLPYISGLITTYQSFAQQYGYFEVDAELPAGQGLWSAFFLLPDQVTFASELDVFEVLGNSPTTLYSTVHGFDDGVQTATTAILNTADTSAGFHTYGVDWEPATTTFYIDGAAVASMPTPATMDNPMYMLLTLAVGSAGSWPGAPTSSTSFPANLQIDDVRAYATANTILVSGTQAIRTGGISGQVLLAGAAGAGVGISLLNAAGSVVASTTAATDGTFAFTGLAAGSYQLSYSAPSGVVLQTAGGLTSSITVATGQTTALASQNLVAASIAEVSGNVVVNGVEQAGAAVTLLTSNGKTVASTVTNSTGSFAFTGLAPGIYAVKYAALSGTVLPTGGTAASNGVTPTFALAAGQMLSLPAEDLLTSPSTITAKALHFGGPTDPSYGGGDLGVTVSLLNAAGSVIATTVSNATGWCAFGSIAPGTYEIRYTAPAGQTASPGTSLLTAPFSVAAGQTLAAPVGSLMTALTMSGSNVTLAPGSGAYVVTGNASNSTLTLGAGNHHGWHRHQHDLGRHRQ